MLAEHPIRIAVHATGEAGARAARILLGERNLIDLGTYHCSLANPDDNRVQRIDELAGFDVLATDDIEAPEARAAEALASGVSCVTWSDFWQQRDTVEELGGEFAAAGLSLVIGASLGSGLAAALAAQEAAWLDSVDGIIEAWTVPGRSHRRGEPLPFPEPVGSRWGRQITDAAAPSSYPTRRFVAPVGGEWAGAVARVSGRHGDSISERVVGVADLGGHLEGLAIAAAALAAAEDAYEPGLQWPAAAAAYLERALEAGLDVAAYSTEEPGADPGT